MSEPLREVDLDEGALTWLLLGLVGMVSLAFFLGVSVGRDSAPPLARARDTVVPASTASPGRASSATPGPRAAPSTALGPAGGRPRWGGGVLGPPPLPRPRPLGGVPGVSQRADTRAVALEVLALDDQERALKERVRLLGLGYPAYVAAAAGSPSGGRYRVRVGDYASAAEAERVAEELRTLEDLKVVVVK